MAIVKTRAIVLDRRDYSETSLVVRFYTQDYGKFQTIIKGAKRPKGNFRTSFSSASLNEIVFYQKRPNSLHIVTEALLLDDFRFLKDDIKKISYAQYCIELIDKIVISEDPNPGLFALLVQTLHALSLDQKSENIARIFELKALTLIGLSPDFSACQTCDFEIKDRAYFSYDSGKLICKACAKTAPGKISPLASISQGTINTVLYIQNSDFQKALKLQIPVPIQTQLKTVIPNFIRYHIQSNFKTLEFLKKV